MADIIFNYEEFYGWYNKYYNDNDEKVIEKLTNLYYFKFERNGTLSRQLDGFKRLIYLSEKYGNYLNVLNKHPPPFKRYNSIFINRMTNSK
jgi:hypothetical protein